jgi:hypothetical protein
VRILACNDGLRGQLLARSPSVAVHQFQPRSPPPPPPDQPQPRTSHGPALGTAKQLRPLVGSPSQDPDHTRANVCPYPATQRIYAGQGHADGVPPADEEHSLFLQPSETWLFLEPEVGLPGGIVAIQATPHCRYPLSRRTAPCDQPRHRRRPSSRPSAATGNNAPAMIGQRRDVTWAQRRARPDHAGCLRHGGGPGTHSDRMLPA